MTIDGYIGGPNGEMDWMAMPWTDDINQYVTALNQPVDTIVLGRKLAEGFIPYWASVAADETNPEQESGRQFTDTAKVVFTKTLDAAHPQTAGWNNTTLATGDLASEINNLKQGEGNDIIAYGGASFVSSLIKEGLIDEYHLFINPEAIGKGLAIFTNDEQRQHLSLVKATTFECGIVALHYVPKKD